MPGKKSTVKKVSPYTILNRWLYDGSLSTPVPNDICRGSAISQTILLYHFQQSRHIVYLSETFNNYYLYSLEKREVFKFLKDCVIKTGFKPKFIKMQRDTLTKAMKILRLKYPCLKTDDIKLLIEKIDESPNKDQIYETIGIYTPKKKKSTKADKKEIEVAVKKKQDSQSLHDIMENFG